MFNIRGFIGLFYAKKRYFSFWNNLNLMSLRGMNIGSDLGFEEDGEAYVLSLVADRMEKKETEKIIFDVGANIGNYTTEIIKKISDVKIYSFEPMHKTYQTLCDNMKDNRSVHTVNKALGVENGTFTIYYDRDQSTLASMYKRELDHFGINMDKSDEIDVMTLDDFCENNNITHIDFLKLDVEGNELNVFIGAKSMIERGAIDYIQFEFGGCNIDSRTYFRDFWLLLNKKYRFYRIMKDGIIPIEKYHERLEQLIYSNYFLERL